MTENNIVTWFNRFDLDLRKSKDGTALDMKDTPDVVSFIADCIVHYVDERMAQGENLENIEFSAQRWAQAQSLSRHAQGLSPHADRAGIHRICQIEKLRITFCL